MFKRENLRRGVSALALLVAGMLAACTGNSDPTGVEDKGPADVGERIEAAQVL